MQERVFHVEPMSRPVLGSVIDWAAAEGWNPGFDDAECFYAADPDGFWVGMLDDEVIASLSAVRYGEDFAFIGFYMVKPEYRHQGYGLELWHTVLEQLEGRTLALDGVPEQQDNYAQSGFELAWNNTRYRYANPGVLNCPDTVSLAQLQDLDAIIAYDRECFPAERYAFLQVWLAQPHARTMVYRSSHGIQGYGVIRICREGYKVGPLFADTPDIAHQLWQGLVASTSADQPVFLDVPEVNADAVDLALEYNMESVFSTARMVRGEHPDLAVEHQFGISTFELG